MAEPAQRRTAPDGGRFYEHPSITEDVPGEGGSIVVRPARYDSVTWALDSRNKEALVYWSGNVAARRAMENLPQLIASILIPDCGRARARTEPFGCGRCEACVEVWVALTHHGEKARRAREGTAAHDILERWIATGKWLYAPTYAGDPAVDQYVPTQETMAPYITALQAWVADFGLMPEDFQVSECTVWNHRLRYAGTLDFIVVIHPRTAKAAEFCARVNYGLHLQASSTLATALATATGNEVTPLLALDEAELLRPVVILGDCKSREKIDESGRVTFYSEQPLQGVAYQMAETMTLKGAAPELERPMMSTDAFAVLQVRPGEYTFRPMLTTGQEMRAFEAVLVNARWERDRSSETMLVRAFPLPTGWKPPGEPKKATRKRAAPAPVADGAAAPPVKATKRAAKKAAPVAAGRSSTLDSMRTQLIDDDLFGNEPLAPLPDDDIPF